MTKPSPHILIAGAGIGGLTAAIALAKHGAKVDVFEAADTLSDIGAGLQLSANAMHVLSALGFSEAISARAFQPVAAVMREFQSGTTQLSVPLKRAHKKRYGQDYLHIHRADLHTILAKAAETLGVKIHLGHSVIDYQQSAHNVTLRTLKADATGDILIGADGIKSKVREQMLGHNQPQFSEPQFSGPQFTGQTAWRGLIKTQAMPQGLIPPDATVWLGPAQHFVSYYVRGGELINFVAVKEQQNWHEESWQTQGDMNALRAAFEGWDSPVTQLLSACDSCHLWGLFDHMPLPRWRDVRVALLGDAAHPMLPFMAQGAAMAIEDGFVLAAQILRTPEALVKALARYEAARKPRATRLQARSRANAKLYHLEGGAARTIRTSKFKLAQAIPALMHSQLDPIYGYDATKT